MGGTTNVTDNLFYDLVSIQYHALKGQEVYDKFTKDAQGQQEIVQFFEQVKQQDIQRAEQCHRFLMQLTGGGQSGGQTGGGTAEPYPTDRTAGQTSGQTAGSGSTR
jgi:hypothetical protein